MPFLNLRSNCRWLYFLERTSCTHQWSDWKTSASWYVSFHLSVLISSAFRNSQGRGEHKLSSKSQKEHFICQQDVLLQAHVCFSAIFPACFLFCSILNIDSYTILIWFCMHRTKDLNKSQIFPDFLYTVQDFKRQEQGSQQSKWWDGDSSSRFHSEFFNFHPIVFGVRCLFCSLMDIT